MDEYRVIVILQGKMTATVCQTQGHIIVHEHVVSLLLTLTGLASLAVSHVVENVLHSAAVGQVTLSDFTVGLFSPLALVCMKQEYQLLLD